MENKTNIITPKIERELLKLSDKLSSVVIPSPSGEFEICPETDDLIPIIDIGTFSKDVHFENLKVIFEMGGIKGATSYVDDMLSKEQSLTGIKEN